MKTKKAQLLLQNLLNVDEEVLWTGQPELSLYAASGRSVRLLQGVGFLAFGLVNTISASYSLLQEGRPQGVMLAILSLGLLISLGIGVIGAVLLLAPYWLPHRARHVLYAVTSKRALVVNAFPVLLPWEERLRCFDSADLHGVLDESRDLLGVDAFFALTEGDERAAREAIRQLLALTNNQRV